MPKRSSTRSARSITSITYWRKFASHRIIYLGIAAVFAIGIVAYFGSTQAGGRGGSGREEYSAEAIATVNGTPIARGDFDKEWETMRRRIAESRQPVQSPQVEASFQGQTLAGLISMALIQNAAKSAGVSVSDRDVDSQIAQIKKQATTGKTEPTDEEIALLKGAKDMNDLRDKVRSALLPKMLGEVQSGARRLTLDDLQKTFDEAKTRQILVAVSTSPAHPQHSLPDDQAKARAGKILDEIKKGKPFEDLANQFTDDAQNTPTKYDSEAKKFVPSGTPKGGDIGWVKREGSGLEPEVSAAVFALKPGEVSPVVKSQLGYHILKVEQVRRTLPKDFDKDKAGLLEQLKETRTSDAITKLIQAELKKAKIVWKDPSYEWMYLYAKVSPPGAMGFTGMADPKDVDELVHKLTAYCPSHPQDSSAALVLGNLYFEKYKLAGLPIPGQAAAPKPPQAELDKMRADAIKYFELGLVHGEDRQTRMILGRTYVEAKEPAKALKHYQALQNALKWDDNPETKGERQQLVKAFLDLNRPDLADIETKKLADIAKKETEDAARKKEYEDKMKAAAEATKKKPGTSATAPGAQQGAFTAPAKPAAGAAKPGTPPAPAPGAASPKPGATAPKPGGAN